MNSQPVATASNYYHHHHHAYAPHASHQLYHDPDLALLGYRPLQLPLQQPHAHHSTEQQQLPVAGFHHYPNFRPQHSLPHRTRQQTRRQQTMAYQDDLSKDEEYAELQKLSNEYEPEVTVRDEVAAV